MKRLITFIAAFFIFTSSLFSQDWEPFPEYTDFLWEEYGLEIEVFYSEKYEYLGFLDEYPQSRFDLTRTVSFVLNSLEYFIDYDVENLEHYGIEGIAFYVVIEPDFSTKGAEDFELEIELNKEWLESYYDSSDRRRNDFLSRELNQYF